MSQIYLNSPSTGSAISAEEFIAQSGAEPTFGPIPGGSQQGPSAGCGCQNNQWNGCCRPMVCCCQPVQCPEPVPVDEDACCCKQSFRAALQLLCNATLASLLDFSAVAFVTDDYLAGSIPQTPVVSGTDPADNLADELTGTFRRFSPCSCDLLDISAPVYPTDVTSDVSVLTAAQMSLCALDALCIQAAEAAAEGDLSADEVAARNFRQIKAILSAGTTSSCVLTGSGSSQDCDSETCCCSAGLLDTLSNGNLSRQVSLVAGPLVLTNVTLLGTVGNVLVLANDTDDRIYFVCVNSVQFIG